MTKLLKKIIKNILFHGIFPLVYLYYGRKPVIHNRVLFIEIRYDVLTNNFHLLYKEFSQKKGFTVDTCFLGLSVNSYREYIKQCFRLLPKLALAEYVFVNESSNMLAALPVRKDTKLVQTWHGCGAFKCFGYEGVGNLKEAYYNTYNLVTVSSPQVVDIYARSMKVPPQFIDPIGVSRTDVFFNQEYISGCNDRIRKKYSIHTYKKIILYAPTFRGNVHDAQPSKLLDVKKMYDGLGEEYVILYKGHPAVSSSVSVPEQYASFFIDVSGEAIEQLMCGADLCITDYSSLIFEYALLERPMYFFAYDYKDYVTKRGFYYEYKSFVPGPICFTEEELVHQIQTGDRKEILQKVTAFKNRFMSACDGHSTQRIIDRIISDSI